MALVFIAAHPGAQTSERLGSVTFPTSCAADLQKPFERAVSLLHSFVYEDAQAQFEDVFKKDPHCAIALWGEAMSIYYPLWFQPNAGTIQHGRELIEQARKVGAKTERERAYIEALATFYQGPDTDYEARTEAYAHAMENLATRYPEICGRSHWKGSSIARQNTTVLASQRASGGAKRLFMCTI
jgi:hypothetical protein